MRVYQIEALSLQYVKMPKASGNSGSSTTQQHINATYSKSQGNTTQANTTNSQPTAPRCCGR